MIGLVEGPAEGAVPGGKLIAVYELGDGGLAAVAIRGGGLYGVNVSMKTDPRRLEGSCRGGSGSSRV